MNYGLNAPARSERDTLIDWAMSLSFKRNTQSYRRWADNLAGTDMKLATLCRDLQHAHEAIIAYCKSVRNNP